MSVPPGTDLNNTPAGTPPPGQTSNLINPPSLQKTTIAVFSTLLAVATLFVVARVWFNVRHTRRLLLDDVFTILAWMFSVAQSAVVLSFSKLERHQWDIPLAWYNASYFKRNYAQSVIAWPALFFAKVAILFLFRRIFGVMTYMQICIWVGLAWAVITYLPNIFINSYYCAPHVGEQWTLAIGERCGVPLKWEIASASMSIMLDLFILVIPIPIIATLQLSRTRRLGLLALFLTASLAVVCAILTLVYRIQIFLNQNNDSAWEASQLYICNGAENYTAIIVGCVPGVSSFFRIYVRESRLYSTIADSLLSRLSPGMSTKSRDTSQQSTTHTVRPKKQKKPDPWSLLETNVSLQPTSEHQENDREYIELRDAGHLVSSAPLDEQ